MYKRHKVKAKCGCHVFCLSCDPDLLSPEIQSEILFHLFLGFYRKVVGRVQLWFISIIQLRYHMNIPANTVINLFLEKMFVIIKLVHDTKCMYVCICVYVCTHARTHTYIHTYVHTYIHTYVSTVA
jgi:hypothetical protein